MPSCLVIGDCHFKTNNVIATEAMTKAILEKAVQKTPDFIVMLGDTLDRHENINSIVLTQVTDFLHNLSQIAPVYLLIGNHDRPNNSDFLSNNHPFTALRYWKNIIVVDKVHINKDGFIFVPYVPPGRFHEALATLPQNYKGARAIFAHQEFKGAKMGAIISTEGDIWDPADPFVISGHIHDYDELQNNLLYTGTPMQHAFGDKEDKTISYFIFNDDNTRTHERINLGLAKKRMLYFSCEQLLKLDLNTLNTKDEIKIIVKGTSAEIKTTMKLALIKELSDKGIKIAYKEIITDKTPNTSFLTAPGKSYYEKLTLTLANNPEMIQVLTSMFGPLKLKI